MEKSVALACASIRQGNKRFISESRGRQAIFMSLADLVCIAQKFLSTCPGDRRNHFSRWCDVP